MDNDDLWDTQMPLKMNKQFMNLRHGLFANFNGKHFVVGAGRSNEKYNSSNKFFLEFFLWKWFLMSKNLSIENIIFKNNNLFVE